MSTNFIIHSLSFWFYYKPCIIENYTDVNSPAVCNGALVTCVLNENHFDVTDILLIQTDCIDHFLHSPSI